MEYTEADLAIIKEARMKLDRGARVVRITIDGKSIEYTASQAKELREREDEIAAKLPGSVSRPRVLLVRTSKGL